MKNFVNYTIDSIVLVNKPLLQHIEHKNNHQIIASVEKRFRSRRTARVWVKKNIGVMIINSTLKPLKSVDYIELNFTILNQ